MTLRIGMVGAGKTAFKIARRLAAYSDVKIVAVADHSRPERDLFTKTFGCPLSTGDYERLILNSSVDVIYIASPPSTRSGIAVDSLKADKHVICEQPMAITLSQADEVIDAESKSDGRLFVALPQLYNPVNQEAARMIDADEIGFPYLVLSTYLENNFDRLSDWHDWMGTWDVGGGGILMHRGSEIIDLLIYLLGSVEAVSAVCTRFAVGALNKAEDSCLLEMEFTEEIAAQMVMTGAARYSAWPNPYSGCALRLDIYGMDGAIQIINSEHRLLLSSKGTRLRQIDESEIKTDLPTDMYRNFIDCILQDGEPLVTSKQARDALRVILAGYKASQMKRRVEIMEHI
jgi:predicted dehydrogenase